MAKLSKEKLLKADFIDRFLGFVEKYETVLNIDLFDIAAKWLAEEDFDSIKYFLHVTPIEYSLPFSMKEFIYMSYSDLLQFQNKCAIVLALLDEKLSLYQELLSFYD